jgi:hypothetical protein
LGVPQSFTKKEKNFYPNLRAPSLPFLRPKTRGTMALPHAGAAPVYSPSLHERVEVAGLVEEGFWGSECSAVVGEAGGAGGAGGAAGAEDEPRVVYDEVRPVLPIRFARASGASMRDRARASLAVFVGARRRRHWIAGGRGGCVLALSQFPLFSLFGVVGRSAASRSRAGAGAARVDRGRAAQRAREGASFSSRSKPDRLFPPLITLIPKTKTNKKTQQTTPKKPIN